MRWVLGYFAACVAAIVVGLVLDALDVAVGGWLAVAGVVAFVAAFWALPERDDVPIIALLVAIAVPVALVLYALDAPDWSFGLLVGLCGGWLMIAFRRENERSGRIGIPAGYRFGQRKRG